MGKMRDLIRLFCLLLLVSCGSDDCPEDAAIPLTFDLRFVNSDGVDLYADTTNIYQPDSVSGYYVKLGDTIQVEGLRPKIYKKDSTCYVIDGLQFARVSKAKNVNTFFLSFGSQGTDTIEMDLRTEISECFSTQYYFQQLKYNELNLEMGQDSLFTLIK